MCFDFNIVKRQVMMEYLRLYGNARPDDEWSLKTVLDIFRYFYGCYYHYMGKPHPKLSNKTIRSIISGLPYLDCDSYGEASTFEDLDPEMYLCDDGLIDAYFKTKFDDCDYSMAHFMSGRIRELRVYDVLYG